MILADSEGARNLQAGQKAAARSFYKPPSVRKSYLEVRTVKTHNKNRNKQNPGVCSSQFF